MNKWDFVVIEYPYTDLTQRKARPGIVVSSCGGRGAQDLIVVAVTSQLSAAGNFAVMVPSTHAEYTVTGLLKSSVILVNKMFTLAEPLVVKRLGVAGPPIQAAVEKQLRELFDL